MHLFISYSRRDELEVRSLAADLERAQHSVWMDTKLTGGQQWWDELLDRIRSADALIFALSPDSIDSRACGAELAYAVAAGRHVVPVQLQDVNIDLAPPPIGTTHIVDYRGRTTDAAISLMNALSGLEPRPAPADPPPTPPAPITDLAPIRDQLGVASLTFDQQQDLLEQLRRRIGEHDQLETLHSLLDRFEQRGDVVSAIERGVAELRSELPVMVGRQRVSRRRRAEPDDESVDRLRALVAQARAGKLTPIVGHGANDRMIGSTKALAREWSRSFEFPMAEYRHEELADVAQFIAVMTGVDALRSSLGDYLLNRLDEQRGDPTAEHVGHAVDRNESSQSSDGASRAAVLTTAMNEAWRTELTPEDPYEVLAALPCPVYIVANPWDLMGEALRKADREPVVEVCEWREDVWQWPPSIFRTDPNYMPTVERPLVFHAFGALSCPDSLVITQDDFDDFQIAVAKNPGLIPPIVQRVLANSAITMLGFELDDRDVRVLMRSLIAQEGSQRLNRFTHVAVQMELTGDATSPDRARRYFERYFGKIHQPSIDLFWGSVDDFCSDLASLWKQGG